MYVEANKIREVRQWSLLNAPTVDRWYRCMFFNLRLEMEAYLRYEKAFERIVSGCLAEDCEDGMEYNEEWEDDEYDPDEV